MKDFRGMKRQRSRSRKPSGNQNNPNRAYESNGPEGTKVRGNAQTIYEKYQQLARDANSSGDRVLAENHLQHAEHYFRMIRQMQPTRPVSEFVQRDPFSNGFDDYDDEIDADNNDNDGDNVVGAEDAQPSFEEPRYDNNRDRDNNRNGNRNPNGNGNGNRNFKDRDNRPAYNEPRNAERNERPERAERNDRNDPQFDENGNRRETRRERYERRRQQRFAEQQEQNLAPVTTVAPEGGDAYTAPAFIASTQPLGAAPRAAQDETAKTQAPSPAPETNVSEAPAAKTRTPRQPRASTEDASHLPAFLHKPAPVAVDGAEPAAKPKRTRRKKEDADASEEA
ncbi:MAG: DUF4167 domain-containing protein [Asticcacaulis sp.]